MWRGSKYTSIYLFYRGERAEKEGKKPPRGRASASVIEGPPTMLSAGELSHHERRNYANGNSNNVTVAAMVNGISTSSVSSSSSLTGHAILPQQAPTATSEFTPAKAPRIQHIWMITGPAGSGKSTVSEKVCRDLGAPFLEGDDVGVLILPHPSPKHPFWPFLFLIISYSTTRKPTRTKCLPEFPSPTETAGTG